MKPLNVWSKSDEEIGRFMSNFARTPFVPDEIQYSSIEGFYAALLIQNNEARQSKVRRLWGIRAKHEIPKNKPHVILYNGETFNIGSKKHICLIKSYPSEAGHTSRDCNSLRGDSTAADSS